MLQTGEAICQLRAGSQLRFNADWQWLSSA